MEPHGTIYALDPACLPPGAELGTWRVLALRGKGAYGAVYRVEPIGEEGGGPFALKLALHPGDPRFEREVELLSRIAHPNVPKLVGRGQWAHPEGSFPFIVMEWVEGVPLYDWAEAHKLSWRQVMRVLAQVARALEATHAVEGVHRDVKGSNVLVRPEDGKAALLDFGVGDFRGAPTLTREVVPPGTSRYRSPEARCFQWLYWSQRGARYEPGPADDVYALGVTAYRLVADDYPPPAVDPKAAVEGTIVLSPVPELPKAVVRACPELSKCIRQMLSEEPSARGSAAQVAQKLERAVETAGPRADQPMVRCPAPVANVRASSSGLWRSARMWAPRLAVAAALVAFLAFHAWRNSWTQRMEQPGAGVARQARNIGVEDAGTTGLGEDALMVRARGEQRESIWKALTLEIPKKPLPGQVRPPCNKREVAINGGCWIRPEDSKPPCGERYYEWDGGCYYPAIAPNPPSTSEPP